MFIFLTCNNLRYHSSCQLPESLIGDWFYPEHSFEVHITENSFDLFGNCQREFGSGTFLFQQIEFFKCFHCVTFVLKHENILEFKSGDCDLEDILLCKYPDYKNTSNFLIRVDRKEVECPELRASTFSYDTGKLLKMAMSSLNAYLDLDKSIHMRPYFQ